jgi:predicted permease
VIVLLGVVGFVAGCFLPYLSGNFLPAEGTISLFRLIWLGAERPLDQVGVLLQVFAGAATVGVIALLGIGRRRTWTPHALVAGAAAWTLTWIGLLMSEAAFGSHEVGYWVLLASMGVAIIGTVVVWVSAKADAREPTTGASSVGVAGSSEGYLPST